MPETIDAVLQRGQEFEENEEYDKALFLYDEMLKKFQGNYELLTRLAHVAELTANKDKAIECWQKIIEFNPSDAGAYSKLTDLFYGYNNFQYYMTRAKLKLTEEKLNHAISDFKKAVENANNDKETAEATFLLAQVYMQTGKDQQAVDEFNKLLNIEVSVIAYFMLSQLYEKEDISLAIDTMKQAIEKFPNDNNLKERLAYLYTKQNNPDEALKVAQSPVAKAKALLQQGKNEDALVEINKINSKNYDYFSLLAEYYFNSEKFDECLKTISNLEKINALNPAPYQMKALVYEEKDDKFRAYLNWGKCYELQGKLEMALNEYLSAHQENGQDVEAISHIINIYENLNDKYPALEFLQKAVEIDPKNVELCKKLGDYYIKEGNYDSAVDCLEKCVENGANDYSVYGKLAKIYDKNKKYQKALPCYEQFLMKAPVSPDSEYAKTRIDELRAMDFSQAVAEQEADEEGIFDKIINLFKRNK